MKHFSIIFYSYNNFPMMKPTFPISPDKFSIPVVVCFFPFTVALSLLIFYIWKWIIPKDCEIHFFWKSHLI